MDKENTTSQAEDRITTTSVTNQPYSTTPAPLLCTIPLDGTSSDNKPTSNGSTIDSTHLEVPDNFKDTTLGASTSGSVIVIPHSDMRTETISEGIPRTSSECTDYTVDNIGKLCSTSRASVDTISIAQDIEEEETSKRRFIKTTSVKHKNFVAPVQLGPIDSFFYSVRRKLSCSI